MSANASSTRARAYDRAAILDAVCAEVVTGATLRAIFAQPGMPDCVTFFRWLHADPAMRARYWSARQAGADVLFERFEELADSATQCKDAHEVQALRLRLDMMRWSLAKRAPKLYGDRIDHTSGGQALQSFSLAITTA
jgi:hypothetical protein